MQVATLQLFLRSLVPALDAAAETRPTASALARAADGLAPFAAVGLDDFAAFLHKADEFQRTGTVRVPIAADRAGDQLLQALQALAAARTHLADGPARLEAARSGLADALKHLADTTGLKATLKADPKWAAAQVEQARIGPFVRRLREMAPAIQTPEDYGSEAVARATAELTAELQATDLKPLAAAFGVKATPKSQPAKVICDILTSLTGHAVPKPGKKAKGPDPTVVEPHARRLKALFDRAADLADAEVEAEMGQLEALPKAVLHEVARQAGLEGVAPKDSATVILQRIRNRLTVAQRARERAEV